MIEPTAGIDIDERASWVDLPDVGRWVSWKNRKLNPGIMDGGYMGLNGDPIFGTNEQVIKARSGKEIAVCNPGAGKVSLKLKQIFYGKILVVLDSSGVPDREITFPEAVNDSLLTEATYPEVWRYVSADNTEFNSVQSKLVSKKIVPENVYRVTKNGAGKIGVANRDMDRPDIIIFSGLRFRI